MSLILYEENINALGENRPGFDTAVLPVSMTPSAPSEVRGALLLFNGVDFHRNQKQMQDLIHRISLSLSVFFQS
jgi:hypothetical protein